MWCKIKSLGTTKCSSTMELTGCTLQQFRYHLEAQFTNGMTCDPWQLALITSVRVHHLTLPILKNRRHAFITQIGSLWARDNISKGSMWQGSRRGTARVVY